MIRIVFLFFSFFKFFEFQEIRVIYVSLSKIPKYLSTSINQLLKTNPKVSISLIHSYDNFKAENHLNISSRIELINYQSLNDFQCNECNSILEDLRFFHKKNLFYTNTVKRYLAIYLCMKKYDLNNVFHVESDNMIYGNFSELLNDLKYCKADIANPDIIGNIFFFKNKRSALFLLRDFSNTLIKWKKSNILKLWKNQSIHINDMHMLSYFKSRHVKNRKSDLKVMDLPFDPNRSKKNCLFQKNPKILYDPNFFGQLLGGTPNHPMKPFINSHYFKADKNSLYWKVNGSTGFKKLYYYDYEIFNLHIHCKKLELFKS
jgi:hypothetical protein